MSVQAVKRLLRLFWVPVSVCSGGFFLDSWLLPMLASVNRRIPFQLETAFWEISHWSAIALMGLGALWLLYRLRLYCQWRSGHIDGGCPACGGLMRHLQEPQSIYSECMMCGLKINGWVTEQRLCHPHAHKVHQPDSRVA